MVIIFGNNSYYHYYFDNPYEIDPNIVPTLFKVRNVPLAIEKKNKEKLEHRIKQLIEARKLYKWH